MDAERREGGKKGIQRDVIAFFRKLGCVVYCFSEGRRARLQTKGVADLYVLPRNGRGGFWFETKTPKGSQSADQQEFAARCATARVAVVVGGMDEAQRFWNAGFGP